MRDYKHTTIFKSKITILIILITILLCGTIISHASSNTKGNTKSSNTKGWVEFDITNRHTFISTNKNGVLNIKRDLYKNERPMSDDDTWTILMYVAGTNLESSYSNATADFKEMMSANFNSTNAKNINLIIQTGACRNWHTDNISSNKIGRYKIDNSNNLTLIEEKNLENMGSPDTLCDFLTWGAKNYPAKHMGVIFWNHGSGVENGVCQDPLFKNDPLTLNEIEFSFARTRKYMSSPFDFIGFDTCLSGSIEYANILAPYAKYMVASADLEPNNGWYYTPIINSILDNPTINGYELGKVICDSYSNYYQQEDQEIYNNITIALYDLSKVDDVCIETNYLTKYMLDKLVDNPEYYYTFSNDLRKCTKYSESCIDIGSLLTYFDKSNEFDYNTYYYRQAINKLIAYTHIGKEYVNKNCLGLTLYCPDSVLSLYELENARNTVFSPYWLKFIERMTYRRVNKDMDGFHEIHWEYLHSFYENTFNFMNYSDFETQSDRMVYSKLNKNDDYVIDGFPLNWYNNFQNENNYGQSPFIVPSYGGFIPLPMSKKTNFNIYNNTINATLKLELDNTSEVSEVYNSILLYENENIICLGENNDASYNNDTQEATTKFNGEWFMLPDGQFLTTYILSSENNTTVYGIPVYINDNESTIRIEETKNPNGTKSYKLLGVWDALSNSTYAGRGYIPLNPGTTIIPIYDAYNQDSKKFTTEYGQEYTIRSNFDFLLGKLPNGEYSYSFNIVAANGINYLLDLKNFEVKNNNLVSK